MKGTFLASCETKVPLTSPNKGKVQELA